MVKCVKVLFFFSFLTVTIYLSNGVTPFVGGKLDSVAHASDEAPKALDVVCGMKIAKDGAEMVEVGGKHFYFCSDNCKAVFKADPGKVTCMCFVGVEPGDDPCECSHCSGKGGKCKCSEHGGHDEHGHEGHDHG